MYLVPNKISGNSITHFAQRNNEKPRLSGDSRGQNSNLFFYRLIIFRQFKKLFVGNAFQFN